jgi:serine/threonine protein kinase/Tfp pilus assembly protein PilF
MGEVYLATDITAGRKAALKLLPVPFALDTERLKRFQQEAQAVVALNHPNILTVYEIGEDHSTHYIASELIEGETLRQRLTRGRTQLNEAVDIAIQVASALAAAHGAGIVHRDVKPENIMLRPDGYVKVLDFGIAKLAEQEVPVTMPRDQALLLVETNLGSILGTVRYMSPEQARGAQVNTRTDIWSLGVVLYEMVTGNVPFTGDSPREVMTLILETDPPLLTPCIAHAPAELQQIIGKTLRKNPAERYQSAHELLEVLKGLRHKLEVEAELQRSRAWLYWTRSPTAVALALLVAALAGILPFYWYRNPATSLPSDKSIAVLPFENLSNEQENAFFAGGVQDEILSDLAKVADLKVISRTSANLYKAANGRDSREIGQQLGVGHLLEGSVQRIGNRLRVNAQLIDTRTDTHTWAETYDREVNDIFAIQSEIAQAIANKLRAKLSETETAAIAEWPTADLVAYAYYTKAKEIDIYGSWQGAEGSVNEQVELLEKATQHDPNFTLAYCALAKAQTDLCDGTDDPKHLELAKKAVEAALRVRPDLPEPHLALARYYWFAGSSVGPAGATNYDLARDELAIVRRKLPNNSEALFIEAMIDRHQNRWDGALSNLQNAKELDPRNAEVDWHLCTTYFEMRRYSEAEELIKKNTAMGTVPSPWAKTALAEIKLAQGDPVAAQSLLEQVPLEFSPTEQIWRARFNTALYLRDYDAANRVIAATPEKYADGAFGGPSDWAEGLVARARGDKQKTLAAFSRTRAKLEAKQGSKPEETAYLTGVARVDAGVGRKDEAIGEAQHQVELVPIAEDSVNGPTFVANLALVYAWTGERDRALEQLETVATLPGYAPTYGDLRFNPCWDDLRSDSRFDKIVAAAKAASR